jgi:Concanavalin A-like lectin/glucanases superfamily
MGDPTDGSLDFGSGDFTVEAWVRGTANDERSVVTKRPYGTPQPPYWQFTITDDSGHTGQIRANIFDGAASLQAYGPTVRTDDGLFHHVVVVFDRDAGISVFVDGVGKFTAGAVTGSVSSAGEFLLGKAGGYAYFKGDLDEVAVYPTSLSAARVNAHYAAARGIFGPGRMEDADLFSAVRALQTGALRAGRTAKRPYRIRQSRARARR